MTRVGRYDNSYGNHNLPAKGASRYRVWRKSGNHGSWTGTMDRPIMQGAGATRLVPRKSDYSTPTDWGAYAYRSEVPAFDYITTNNGTSGYQWQGLGDITTMKVNLRGYPPGVSISRSSSAVIIGLPAGMKANAHNQALEGLSKGMNAALFFAEINESLGTIADILQRIARAYRAAKRGDWYNVYRQLGARGVSISKDAANNWLQFQYGIMPMVMDMYDLQEHIKDGLSKKGDLITSSGSAVDSVPPQILLQGNDADSKRYSGPGSRYGCKVVLKARISNSTLHNLNRLGMLNPLALAWELVPLSFVIDWFLPIGSFLNGLTAPLGTTFASGYETTFVSSEGTCEYCRYGWPGYYSGTAQKASVRLFASQRLKLTSFPTPSIGLGGGINSVRRALSALSLLRQRG